MTANPLKRRVSLNLQAFVDGELSAQRHAAVAAAVAGDPALAAEVAKLNQSRALFERLAEELLSRPVPERLAEAALRPPAGMKRGTSGGPNPTTAGPAWLAGRGSARGHLRQMGLAATFAAIASLAVLSGPRVWHQAMRQGVAGEPIVTAALAARDDQLHPVREILFRNDADAHGALPGSADRFLSDGLVARLHAPDLRRAGFTLDAAELFDGKVGRAVQLRYLDRNKRLFTVYIHPGAGRDRFLLLSYHRVRVCLWENEDASTVMTGALSPPELFRLASMAYTALAL